MSVRTPDGNSLIPLVRPYLNWGEGWGDRLTKLEAILGTLDDERFPGGIVPRYHQGVMQYYALTPSASLWRQLAPLVRASVGTTITDFTGLEVYFGDRDPLERVFLENEYAHGARFTAGSDGQRGRYALSALDRLHRMVQNSQTTPANRPRATGEVLRSFELALTGFDRKSAQETLEFLRENLRLDAMNLAFLTVRLHANFKEWQQIRQLDAFSSLCRTRRTPMVTSALAETVYRTSLSKHEDENDPELALSVFSQEVMPQVGNLFETLPKSVSVAAGKAFLLAAGTSNPPNKKIADRLEGMISEWSEADARFFRAVYESCFQSVGATAPSAGMQVDSNQQQIELLNIGMESPYLERARAGLLAATQLPGVEAAQIVVHYIDGLTSEERDSLLQNRFHRKIYEEMEEVAGGRPAPIGWAAWIDNLADSNNPVSQQFADFATSEWTLEEQLKDDAAIQRLVDSIGSVPDVAQDRLFDAIPHLVRWLQDDNSWPQPRLETLYLALYDILLINLSERWRREAVGVVRELLDALLQLGQDQIRYRQILDDLGEIIPVESGKDDTDVLTELAEVLIVHSSPDPDARQRLWGRIVSSLTPVQSMMTTRELFLINDLGTVFGMNETFHVPDLEHREDPASGDLDGKLIGIYTLTESVAQRCRGLLANLYPGVRVEISHEQDASARLQSLARRADIFVICWKSATHAATEMIERFRSGSQATLYASGKGSTSILKAIGDHLLD